MALLSRDEKPHRWEWWSAGALIAVAVLFSMVVELRSACLSRRMGDLGCFLRGGWAVRSGHDLYDVTCDNGWHYNYPPLFAILMVPLADPPSGFDSTGMVPYTVSVAIFYGLSLFWLGLAVHWMAEALEASVPSLGSRPGSRRWLYLRVFPVWACILPIGHSLSRGQVTTLWMLIVAGLISGILRGRRLTAGLYLAAAICLKIIPAYLLIYPLWRRDGRLLAGCALGLALGLVVVPVAVMGPVPAYEAYCHLGRALLGPALGLGGDHSRAAELIGMEATNNVSFQAAIHHMIYGMSGKPSVMASPWVREAHWLLAAVLTLATLAAAGWRRPADPLIDAVFFGSLMLLNLLVSPVCHTLYFGLLCAPLAMLMALEWRQQDSMGRSTGFAGMAVSRRLAGLGLVIMVFNAIPLLPVLEEFRNFGVAMYVVLFVWLVGCIIMVRLRRGASAFAAMPAERSAA